MNNIIISSLSLLLVFCTFSPGSGQFCAFSAYYEYDTISSQHPLIFSDVKFNIGDAYDPRRGTFTAPQKGVYAINLSIATTDKGDEVSVKIRANGREVGRVYAKDAAVQGDQTSISLVLQLFKGDKVSLVALSSGNDALDLTKYYNVFSGYLIHAL